MAGGFVIAMNPFKQLAQSPELVGIPGGLARLFAQAELRQGPLRRGEVSLLLVVVKDAGGSGQVLRVRSCGCSRLREKSPQAARLFEKIEIALDQLRRPQR